MITKDSDVHGYSTSRPPSDGERWADWGKTGLCGEASTMK